MEHEWPEVEKMRIIKELQSAFNKRPEFFPGRGSVNYPALFQQTNDYLNVAVHPYVAAHAILADDGGFLTDHGPEHIRMVMRRADTLLKDCAIGFDDKAEITPYEVFLLLLAIHFHDVGNLYGREGHEQRILDTMPKVSVLESLSIWEKRAIAGIARAHGGKIHGDKDTIGASLQKGAASVGETKYRPQLLAAILRLADELAEDRSRANSFAMLVGALPPESEAYHAYAMALNSLEICHDEERVKLHFVLDEANIVNRYGKGKNPDGSIATVFLFDEILKRAQKTFCELLYCNKFLRPASIKLHAVEVQIEAWKGHSSYEPFETHKYVLHERGYPSAVETLTFADLCESFDMATGEKLKQHFEATGV